MEAFCIIESCPAIMTSTALGLDLAAEQRKGYLPGLGDRADLVVGGSRPDARDVQELRTGNLLKSPRERQARATREIPNNPASFTDRDLVSIEAKVAIGSARNLRVQG
jgi:hypothetical protein